MKKSYKMEVLCVGETKWATNALRFATEEEAELAGRELAGRWFAVSEWRAAESDEEVNYMFDKDLFCPVRLGE